MDAGTVAASVWGHAVAIPSRSVSHDSVPRGVLDAARHGDSDAFMVIYDEYADRLRGLAYRTLGDPGLIDDAMQEIAVKVFRSLPGFRGDSAIGTWLYQITFRTCLNMLRGRGRTMPVPDVEALQPDRAADPADAVLLRLELAAALASLPPNHRAVVFLVLEQELDYRTAGNILGIPPGTVASRLSAARTALSCCLGGASREEKEL